MKKNVIPKMANLTSGDSLSKIIRPFGVQSKWNTENAKATINS